MRNKTKKPKQERTWKNTKKISGKEFHFVQQCKTRAGAKKTAKRIRERFPNKKVRTVSSLKKRSHGYGKPTRHAIYET